MSAAPTPRSDAAPADANRPGGFRDATAAAAAGVEDARITRLGTLLGALLLLVTAIAGTRTVDKPEVLRHAAFGRSIVESGLPDETVDTWSSTAAGRPWANTSWLFDTWLAIADGLAGPAAWSATAGVAAVLSAAGIVFGIARGGTRARAVIAAALAAAVIAPSSAPTPELVTPLFLVATLWAVTAYRNAGHYIPLVALPLLTVAWTNLDPRAFLGPVVLLLVGAAEAIGSATGRERGAFSSAGARLRFGAVAVVCFACLGLGPYPVAQWTAGYDLFVTHDAAARDYFSATAGARRAFEPFWFGAESPGDVLGRPGVAAALLLTFWVTLELVGGAIGLVEVLLAVGFVTLGCLTTREIPVAAAGLAATAAMAARVPNEAKGGGLAIPSLAAVTVVAFAGLLVADLLPTRGRSTVGLGFAPAFAAEVEEFAAAVENPFDDRTFNFRPEEGDTLIWLGRKPFVDSRYGLFGGSGDTEEDLLALHDRVRYALISRKESAPAVKADLVGRPEVWREAFDRFEISHVLVRLSRPNPAYFVQLDLLLSPDWRMTRLTGAGSVFYRADLGDDVEDYLRENGLNFLAAAFAPPAESAADDAPAPTPPRAEWGRPAGGTAFVPFGGGGERVTAAEQRALHYLTHLKLSGGGLRIAPELMLAFAHLAIRDLDAALAEDVTRAEPYRLLGETYRELDRVETAVSLASGGRPVTRRRLYQALNAFGQALEIEPDDPETLLGLLQTYRSYGKHDLALDALDRYRAVATPAAAEAGSAEAGSAVGAEEDARANAFDAMRLELVRAIDPVTALIAKAVEQGVGPLDIATAAWQRGATRAALELLVGQSGPGADRLRALLLLEAARPREASAILARLAEADPAAAAASAEALAYSFLGLARYDEAAAIWRGAAGDSETATLGRAMTTSPLLGPSRGRPPLTEWTVAVAGVLTRGAAEVGLARVNAALCDLEAGRVARAAEEFAAVVERTPPNTATPLAAAYAGLIAGAAGPDATPAADD